MKKPTSLRRNLKVAPKESSDMPNILFYGDIVGTGTRQIRCILVVTGLQELTTLKGKAFIHAWLDAVICHAYFWRHGIEHGDPSLHNILYDAENQCGVLTDFDLVKFSWLPRVPGIDRTGTVPFMALDLLTDQYWNGERVRFYHHELEAFVWILPFVFLLYQDEKRCKHPEVSTWITSDHRACKMAKLYFYQQEYLETVRKDVTVDFEDCWPLAHRLLYSIKSLHEVGTFNKANWTIELPSDASKSDAMWKAFIDVLEWSSEEYSLDSQIRQLKRWKPNSKHTSDFGTIKTLYKAKNYV